MFAGITESQPVSLRESLAMHDGAAKVVQCLSLSFINERPKVFENTGVGLGEPTEQPPYGRAIAGQQMLGCEYKRPLNPGEQSGDASFQGLIIVQEGVDRRVEQCLMFGA